MIVQEIEIANFASLPGSAWRDENVKSRVISWMIIIILYFLLIGNDQHTLVKRQLADDTDDRRRLKTKFVNGVEVVVRGKTKRLTLLHLSFSIKKYLFFLKWKVVVKKEMSVSLYCKSSRMTLHSTFQNQRRKSCSLQFSTFGFSWWPWVSIFVLSERWLFS